jgi:hypothetical protein
MATKHTSRLFFKNLESISSFSVKDSTDPQSLYSCVAPAACFIQQELISLFNQARGDARRKTSSKSQANMRRL